MRALSDSPRGPQRRRVVGGHDRKTREMVVEMLLGERDVFYGHGALATTKLNEFIYPNPTHFKIWLSVVGSVGRQ